MEIIDLTPGLSDSLTRTLCKIDLHINRNQARLNGERLRRDLNNARPHDIYTIQPGHYWLNGPIEITVTMTIIALTKGEVIISCTNPEIATCSVFRVNANIVRFHNLVINTEPQTIAILVNHSSIQPCPTRS